MNRSYYLCLDCGLTATKAAIFDDKGTQLASISADTARVEDDEISEIDMEAQWERSCELLKRVPKEAGIPAEAITCVGASGHGGGIYPLDDKYIPVGKAITSMDSRSQGIVDTWAREGPDLRARTRHSPWAGQSVPILKWLKLYRPEEYTRIRWILGAKDWMSYKLTGTITTDRTDASNNAMLELECGRYDRAVFEAFGLEECFKKLPPAYPSAEVIGTVSEEASRLTGLAPNTKVIAGMFDVVACAVGSGSMNEKTYSLIAGTWNINTAFDSRLLLPTATVKTSLGPIPGLYAYVESSATSASNLTWFLGSIDLVSGAAHESVPDYERINEEVVKVPPGSGGLLFLPFIHRSQMALGTDAAFLGMRASHAGYNLIRAIYEGVAFAHRQHLDALIASGIERRAVMMSGGATNSDVWCGIFADVLGRTIETSDASQAGARGIAVACAVATGCYSSYSDAMAAMVRPRRRYEPDPVRTRLMNGSYDRYLAAIGRLSGMDLHQ
jgi:L-xylulokinase